MNSINQFKGHFETFLKKFVAASYIEDIAKSRKEKTVLREIDSDKTEKYLTGIDRVLKMLI